MRYRDLRTHEDFRRVIELERLVWGYTDGVDIVPVPLLVITVKRGGILIGAFDDRDQMVGFVYSLPGVKANGHRTQWSHMLGVLDAYRGAGVGRRLKLAQRRKALELGVDLVEWTYDPMQAINAHLNFRKLGVVVSEYEENIYGESSSPLHHGTPTDRFVAEWWLRDPHVERCVEGPGAARAGAGQFAAATRVNRTRAGDRWPECVEIEVASSDPVLTVEIPTGFSEMQLEAPALASDWRTATRTLFVGYLARGYTIVDFKLERGAGRGLYLLEHPATESTRSSLAAS